MASLTTLAEHRRRTGKPCSMATALTQLATTDPNLHNEVQAWLDGTHATHLSDSDIHHALQTVGHRVGRQTVGRHRRNTRGDGGDSCGCDQ